MNCTAIIKVPFTKTLVAPKEAVVMRSGKAVVFTLEEGKAKWNYVVTGRDNGKEVEIKEGNCHNHNIVITYQLNHNRIMSRHIINRLERLDHLICTKATGTPAQLANKFKLSERCVRGYISMLKELNAPVAYCRKRNSYYYKEEGRFYFRFCKSTGAVDEIRGGGKRFYQMIFQIFDFYVAQSFVFIARQTSAQILK